MDKQTHNLPLGLGAVFRGLSDLLQIAVEIAESGPAHAATIDARPEPPIGPSKGLHAVYGVSVRVGAHGPASVARFGNVRQNDLKEPVIDEEREPMVDVLDEDDYYMVIAELPGVAAAAVNWTIPDDQELVIRAEADDRKYARTIHLTERIQPQTAVSCYENGVLQLKLWKQAQR